MNTSGLKTVELKLSLFLSLSLLCVFSFNIQQYCNEFVNCVDCTSHIDSSRICAWEGYEGNEHGKCLPNNLKNKNNKNNKNSNSKNSMNNYYFDDTCPVNYPTTPTSSFLSNWMSEILPVIKDLTLLDLSYPGTHDTLTYDLSTIVSEGGIDDALILAEILHNYTSVIPGKLL